MSQYLFILHLHESKEKSINLSFASQLSFFFKKGTMLIYKLYPHSKIFLSINTYKKTS